MSDHYRPYQQRVATATTRASRPSRYEQRISRGMRRAPAVMLESLEDEAGFQSWVTTLAHLRGWRCFHDHDSRRNAHGLPDLLLARGSRLIFAELKSECGHVRPDQREWLAQLLSVAEASAGAVGVFVWRPSDRATIEAILT